MTTEAEVSVIMPGSYDPITVGHLDMIRRVAEVEDEVYVVVFVNENKKCMFSLSDRVNMLLIATEGLDNVLVSFSVGRVVDYMREHDISAIVKGYRNAADLVWEREQAEYNMKQGGYETRLILSDERYGSVSSTEVRQRIESGEDFSELVPAGVKEYIDSL